MSSTIKLADIGSGALEELFNQELEKALGNLMDLSTDHKPARSVTVKLDITTDEEREDAKFSYQVTSKLVGKKARNFQRGSAGMRTRASRSCGCTALMGRCQGNKKWAL